MIGKRTVFFHSRLVRHRFHVVDADTYVEVDVSGCGSDVPIGQVVEPIGAVKRDGLAIDRNSWWQQVFEVLVILSDQLWLPSDMGNLKSERCSEIDWLWRVHF